jgi:hypothetical protein
LLGFWLLLFGIYRVLPFGLCLELGFCYLEFILFFPLVIAWILAFVIWNLTPGI